MKKIALLFIVLAFFGSSSYSQTSSGSYVAESNIFLPGYTDLNLDANSLPMDAVVRTISYFDGLGRPQQVISRQSSPGGKDLATYYTYNNNSLDTNNFLPFEVNQNSGAFLSSPGSDITSFYSSAANVAHDNFPLSPVIYEPSPLKRVSQMGYPGSSGQPGSNHLVTVEYLSNSAGVAMYHCKKWTATENGDCSPQGYYAPGSLYLEKRKDENGHISIEFKDGLDRLVLHRRVLSNGFADTYYVYNDMGQLSFVLSPLASAFIDQAFNSSDVTARKYVYFYTYDARGRLSSKTIPGKDIEYFMYDKSDRLVLSQDGNLRGMEQWMFYKYDALGRMVIKGIGQLNGMTLEDVNIMVAHQEYVNEIQTYDAFDQCYGYTNRCLPYLIDHGSTLLCVYYFDRYKVGELVSNNLIYHSFVDNAALDYQPNAAQDYATPDHVQGFPTASRVMYSDENEQSRWLCQATYYDRLGRVVESRESNHIGGYDAVTNLYKGLTSSVLEEQFSHTSDKGQPFSLSLETTSEYDHRNRLLSSDFRVNSSVTGSLDYNYNALGQLIEQNFHEGTVMLQSQDFGFNIRGWLTNINNTSLTTAGEAVPDAFGMKLEYNAVSAGLISIPQYNGNIAAIQWSSSIFPTPSAYCFHYDELDRIKAGSYWTKSNNAWQYSAQFTEGPIAYDLNGNIRSLTRYGFLNPNGTPGIIDHLMNFYYDGNCLIGVNDEQAMPSVGPDFRDNGSQVIPDQDEVLSWEYKYDRNGNLISDLNKGIQNISYNYLNLPENIEFANQSRIRYYYDAQGSKRRKEVYTAGVLTSSKDYAGSVVYEDELPSYCLFDAGRILISPQLSQPYFEYHLKDHLGNVRLAFRNSNGIAEVLQDNSYYPFGLPIESHSYQSQTTNTNPNKYNGKEFQAELGLGWYDYGARMYDGVLGRWHSVDPMADERSWVSPYNYCQNNPIARVDPTGALDDWVEGADGTIYWKDNVTSSNDKDLAKGETYRGTEYRRFENIGSSTYNDFNYKSDKTITSTQKIRPDADGIVTQDESIDWYHFGGGAPLTVDISMFKFKSSNLSIEDFKTNSQSVDFFNGWSNHPFSSSIIWRPASDEALSDVYGTIRLAMVNRDLGTVRVVTDDATGFFDVFNYSSLGSIVGDRLRSNGNPTPFGFFGKGTGTIRLTTPESPKIDYRYLDFK